MTRIYFFKSNGLTKKDQVKMTKEVTNLLSDTAKRRQKDGNETATSDKVIIRTSLGHFLRYVAMIFAVLVMSIANVGMAWADTELANINFKSWTPQSISAGSTVNGCYFKSAVTISAAKGATFGGNASTSANWVSIPLSGINGSITITLTHASGRPQWKNYFKGLNAAPSSSDLSSNPSSVGDNTRPGSNTTTSSWTISTDKMYGVFYVGRGSNGQNDIYSISISTPDWTYYYRGADNDWGGTEMTKSSEGFYSYKSSSTNNHQFKIAKSSSTWDYNYSFVDPGYLGTSISTIGDYGSDNCYIWSAPASYYIIVFRPGSPMNTTASPKICASATLPAEKFTISFNNGGGSGSMSSISNVLYASDKATTANTFTKDGYRFTGWHANVDVKVGGATKTAGTLLDDEVTIQEIKSDITLTAQWEVDDGCNKIFWFAKAADATTNGVTNNTTTFSGVDTGTFGVSGSITIDGKTYSVTGRGSNNGTAITFTVPANKVGTLYGLANSSGSSARTLTLTGPNAYSATQTTSASSSSAGAFTFTELATGNYSMAWSGNGAECMLCLKLCDAAAPSCSATQPGSISKSLSACTLTLTASGDPASNNTWYWQSAADGTATNLGTGATKTVTTTGTWYIRSYCSDGSGCWSEAQTVTVSASDLTPAAPTVLASSSPTAKGVTLTVTDAANTNDYEFYVSTSSSTPGDGTSASYTSTSKSITITDKYAGTTFYAWARAKCGSYKSAWTALTGNTFTTSQVTVTHTLTNVTATSGATGANAAGGSDYTAVFAAVSGYSLPAPAITIDGNAAESGTDYTWTQGTGTVVIPANKITGNIVITIASAAAAPSSVAIGDNWLWFAGETMTLTATPTGGNGPVTYQWYKGGKADGNAIDGATNATFSKTCVFEDAGSYYCKVTCGGTQSTWGQNGDAYEVKVPRLYVKTGRNDGVKSDYGNVDFTRVDASTATASISLGANWDYCFNIADGCGHYYGNAGTMQYNSYGPWVTNVNNQDCGLRTTNGATYVFTINYSNWSQLTTTVTFPSSNQAADKVIYFDNSERQWTNVYYRIGHTSHVQASAMDKVYGTANLYTFTTTEYNNFMGWHITNATGETGSNKNIYNTANSPAISEATAHEGGAVTQSAVTVTPTTSRGNGSDTGINDNCEFFNYDITSGMKTDNVAITAPSNGTITVAYTDVNNAAQSFTSGNRDLAHTVILTSVTATPATGYDLSSLTINGNAHTSGNSYTCSGATTIAASFTLKQTTITINANTANHGSTTPGSVTATYGSALPSFTAAAGVSGYSLTGYFTTATDGTKVINADGTLVASTAYADGSGNWKSEDATLTLYAQYEEEAGEDCTNEYNSPSTTTYATKTFLDVSATNYNTSASTNYYLTYSAYWMHNTYKTWTWWNSNDAGSNKDASTYTYANAESEGYLATASSASGNNGYGGKKIHLTRRDSIWFTGATSVACLNKGNSSAIFTMEVFQVASNGTLSKVGSSYTNATTSVTSLVCSSLNASNYYLVKFYATAASNTYLYQVRFGNACADAPSCTTPTTAFANGAYTVGGSALDLSTLISSKQGSGAITYTVKNANGTGATIAGTSFTATSAGTATVTATQAADGDYCEKVMDATITVSAAPAGQTALVINTLYEVPDMIPSGASLTSSDQFMAGLSANTKFEMIGVPASSSTPKVNNDTKNDKTIDEITFDDGSMWFKGNASLTSNIPTTFGLSFIIPEGGGKLYLYFSDSGTSTNIKLAKSGSSGSKPTLTDGFAAVDVTAGTYYLYGTGTTAPYSFYGLKLCSTYSVSITTNNTTKTSGETGSTAAVNGKAYTATFTANTGYTLPSDVTVSIGGVAQTKGTGYTWTVSSGTGTLTVPAANVTGNIVVTVTGTAAATYALNYECNGAESGCPSNTTASALPNPLPSAPTKDGYTFGGWFTDEDLTVSAVAGAAMTEATTLYAKWMVNSSSECITITHWGTTNATTEAWAGSIADENKYKLAQSGSGTSNNKSTDSNASICLYYATTMSIYDSPTTTTDFANVTSVSFKVKLYNASKKPTITVSVGSDSGETVTLSENTDNSTFKTYTVNFGKQLTGAVKFKNNGSGDSGYKVYLDDIEICTASMSSCTTPVLPTLSNQSLCEGADIAAWNATVTNASAISDAGETVTYSWKKKGNATELANTATFDLGASAAESQAGTYVVTVTVSKTGYASSTATKEVTLTVNEATEVTAITADKATVYPTNSVTLTATANMDATWQWYTCTNAEGAGESSIDDATNASYTITSAGSAGTYYYKVKATGSCGIGSMVYTLTVSAAAGGDCFHFVSVIPTSSDIAVSSNSDIVTPTHATTLEGGTMKVGSQQVNITKNYGLKLESSKSVSITLDAALEAGNVVIVKGTAASAGNGVSINGVNFYDEDNKTFDVSYTVLADDGLVGKTALTVTKYSGSSYLQEIKITGCGTSCTDPEVTASANNSTACVGSSVTFTATGAHAEATYQWQKLDGTWTDISGSGATASTYTIASVVAGDAGKYRVIASHDCNRMSNEVTLSVPSVPDFGSTVPALVSVMQTIALSINTVEATDAVKYRWYKSADATWDAGDTEIGTNKELIKAYDSEAIGSPSYYIFCRAQNACGITTSTAIAVNVTAYVEEDCATRGNESDAEFGFQNSGAGQGSYESTACWTMNSNSKILVYSAPDGKYFKTMKVTIASSSASKASYNWSTNGGSSYTADGVAITGVTTTLTEKTIDLSAHGNVNEVKIGRNFGNGESSGTLYVSKICFEYTDACTATTVTPSTASTNYEMDGSSFTEPTFTVKHGGTAFDPQPTLTYSSSNEDIASVDDDGTVTFNGEAGTVTITASYAGDGTYCASSGSYIINVSCPGGAPKIVPGGTVNMSGCNSSVTLQAKTQVGADFADGTYQWFRNGEEIDGATSSSYTATQAGTYTVERTNTSGCTTPSTNSAVVTSETTEPEVERLVPFQYYHVDSIYRETSIMRFRHLFAVKNSGTLDGKHFKMYVSRNGGAATDVTSSNALVVKSNGDGHVDTVKVDLNKLSGKYSENDELVFTCKAIDCTPAVSDVYKNTITMRVIGATPTLALICSGSSKASGTRKTSELTVGGDFLTGYNVADLCQQTGNTSFDANTEWGLYTRLKENYIVTPVNGYAVFNKLNYEPFDILLLTDYPKASKSDAAATVLDDMADLCDYRPMLSFKAHMVAKQPSKWAAKGFTTSPVVPKNTRTRLNIVCYAHPMFADMKTTATHIQKDNDDPSQIVYTMLTGAGYEGKKGLQGFELEAAENFVTIGLVHYNATPADGTPSAGLVTWTPGSEDRMLVTAVERQENLEARMIMFAVNCGAQSMFTETGRNVVLKCLEYLLDDNPLHVADCSFTFDNGAGNSMNADQQKEACESCTGTKGDGKWSTAANWGPDYVVRPGKDTEVKIAAPVTVDPAVGDGAATNFTPKVRSVRILEGGKVEIPAGSYLEVVSTIRRQDGNDIYPTEANDIVIGSSAEGNGTLIFNNNAGDTKARVDMYSTAKADVENMSAATSTWQYIGTPHNDVAIATYNYYDSWLYQYDTGSQDWTVIPNGGPLVPFRGYCVTHPAAPVVFDMVGTLVATTAQDIAIPAGYTVIANSWVAPIDISTFTDDDMENISDKTIYFFNTGTDADGDHGTGTEAGTYVAVPKNSASYVGTWQIPSMQGFYISTSSAGTLHLDYDRHVRPHSARGVVSNPMYAPRRAAAESGEPNVLKIFARGSRYQDKLVVLEREDFTRGYDSGWDGEAWGGGTLSPMVYVTGEGREDAVSAIPEFEGTVVAFKAGEDSEYRFEFVYSEDAEPLYLFDTENNTYTQIMTGNAYYFTTSDKSPHSRFILTRKNPQVATGVEPTSDSSLKGRAKKLLIEDKMFIMVNGMLYDATGKVVK